MPSAFARSVNRAIRHRALWARGDRVAVALSGGADSVALAVALAELADRADWALVGLVHVNHGLRGESSAADELFCRALAGRLSLPIDVVAVDVRQVMAEERLSIEAAARQLRYDAFEQAAARLSATVLATGHTRDDQAETVLLRLLRGSGTRGVSAIRARRGVFARPLLDLRRAEVRRYLAARGEVFREDESNADESIPRNRLRRVLLPVVEDLWPGGVSALARFADLSADDERWLSAEANRAGASAVRSLADGVELNRGQMSTLARAVARRVVRDAIEQAGGHPTFRDVESVLRLLRSGKAGSVLDLRGLQAEKTIGVVVLRRAGRRGRACARAFSHALTVPGVAKIPETEAVIHASLSYEGSRPEHRVSAGSVVALQAAEVALPLTVRSRRHGDRLRPLGAPGERKLQDLLVDRKVPLAERDSVPIVVDVAGRIVWVAGVAVAEHLRVTSPEGGVVILELKKDRQ